MQATALSRAQFIKYRDPYNYLCGDVDGEPKLLKKIVSTDGLEVTSDVPGAT